MACCVGVRANADLKKPIVKYSLVHPPQASKSKRLRTGDVLVRINDTDVRPLDLSAWVGQLGAPRVTFTFMRKKALTDSPGFRHKMRKGSSRSQSDSDSKT